MMISVQKVPCYLVGLSFFQKWDGKAVGNWTEYSVVIPYRVGRSDGGDPLTVKIDAQNSCFEWIAADGLLESLELNEMALRALQGKIKESRNGIAVRQTQGAFVPGMDTLLQPFLFFTLKAKGYSHA